MGLCWLVLNSTVCLFILRSLALISLLSRMQFINFILAFLSSYVMLRILLFFCASRYTLILNVIFPAY